MQDRAAFQKCNPFIGYGGNEEEKLQAICHALMKNGLFHPAL
jgi:hypothetical protein